MVEVNNSVPAGMVMYFTAAKAPQGWLQCDGSEISIKEYYNLYEVIGDSFGKAGGSDTFKLPDLRGEFIRGYDESGMNDETRDFGSKQKGSLISIDITKTSPTVTGTYNNTDDTVVTARKVAGYDIPEKGKYDGSLIVGVAVNGTKYVSEVVGGVTRPRNIALLPCIKC